METPDDFFNFFLSFDLRWYINQSHLHTKLFREFIVVMNMNNNTALIWQKEASDKSDISRKRPKCVCHFTLTSMEYHDVLSYIILVG